MVAGGAVAADILVTDAVPRPPRDAANGKAAVEVARAVAAREGIP